MPRRPRLHAPEGTMHVVGRCHNREFCFTMPADFHMLLAHLAEMAHAYTVTLYGYTLMANPVHLLLQAPRTDPLARPLRWFFRETTRAWQRTHGRQGHFWERRYWACLGEDDRYALAALRYLDRNPVRAGLLDDPTGYPWSSCATYTLGAPNPLITFHPSYLALSRYPKFASATTAPCSPRATILAPMHGIRAGRPRGPLARPPSSGATVCRALPTEELEVLPRTIADFACIRYQVPVSIYKKVPDTN